MHWQKLRADVVILFNEMRQGQKKEQVAQKLNANFFSQLWISLLLCVMCDPKGSSITLMQRVRQGVGGQRVGKIFSPEYDSVEDLRADT